MSRDQLSTILASVDVRDIKQLDESHAVWTISEPGWLSVGGSTRRQAITAAKLKVLRALLNGSSPVFVVHPDDPGEHGVTSGCHRVAPDTYRLNPEFDPGAPSVDYWLFSLGHWTIFAARAPIATEWPDPLPSTPNALLLWMQSVDMTALITSSADDTDWVIALASNSTS